MDILDSDPHWAAIAEIAEKESVRFLSETSFSQKELLAAARLTVRSKWRNGYPQPEHSFLFRQMTYSEEKFCIACGCGLYQRSPFRLKATPRWGNRHFMSVNWIGDELFVDEQAKRMLVCSGMTGFHFSEVLNKSGSMALDGIYQLIIESLSSPGFVSGRGDLHEEITCDACQSMRYHPNGIGMHAFRKGAFDSVPDICKSAEYFGWGKGADRLIIISQRMYQFLVDNHLDRSLSFAPIEIV